MDAEEIWVDAIQNIIDNIMATIEMENTIIEELMLEEDDPIVIPFYGEDYHNHVFDALIEVIANIELLEEDEDFLLEANRRERPPRHLQVDIESFRTLGDPEFAKHFRMNKATFQVLVLEFGNHLVTTSAVGGCKDWRGCKEECNCIAPDAKLA